MEGLRLAVRVCSPDQCPNKEGPVEEVPEALAIPAVALLRRCLEGLLARDHGLPDPAVSMLFSASSTLLSLRCSPFPGAQHFEGGLPREFVANMLSASEHYQIPGVEPAHSLTPFVFSASPPRFALES